MPGLFLFAKNLEFTSGGETYQQTGSVAYEIRGRLAPDGGSLDLGFSGESSMWKTSFRAVFPCQVVNGAIRLSLPAASVLQAPQVEIKTFDPWVLTTPRFVLGSGIGLGFSDSQPLLKNLLTTARLRLGSAQWINVAAWNGNTISFDLSTGATVFFPTTSGFPPGLIVNDEFRGGTSRLTHAQALVLSDVRALPQSLNARFRSATGALYLHSDLLDTTRLQGNPSSGQPGANELLYQYALSNGALEVDFDRTSSLANEIHWRALPGEADLSPALVCFRLVDEHGHPLLLTISSGGAFRLDQRDGVTEEVAQRTQTMSWEQTNRAVVLEALPAPGQTEGRIPCRLRSLNPRSLPPKPWDRLSLTRPYWLRDGKVAVDSRPPREIHGLAKGAFLARNGAAGNGGMDCHLATRVVQDPAFGKLFVETELVLPDASDWTLLAQTEERELAPQFQDAIGEPQVGLRAAPGKTGELRLPLIDTSYAFANLTGTTRERRDALGRPTGEFPGSGVLSRRGREWIEAVDAQMAGAQPERFELPSLDRQTHTSGFGVVPAAAQPFHSVLDRPPATADLAGTSRTGAWLMAAPPPSLDPGLLDTDGAPPRTGLVFGGERSPAAYARLEQRLRSSGPVGEAAERFLALWADDGALGDPAELAAWRALRGVLAGVRPLSGDIRLSEEFFAAVLGRARELMQSNLDIPWLDAVRPAVERWFLEELIEEWESGGDEVAAKLFEYLWAPPSLELFRHAVGLLFKGEPPAALAPHLGALRALVPYDASWENVLKGNLEGFLAEVAQGVDSVFDEAVRIWRDEADAVLDRLRRRYGPSLTPDVYQSLLEQAEDGAALVGRLREQFGLPVDRLADLKADPPDYLLFTRRFHTAGQTGREAAESLWYHRFDLCDFGDKRWSFFLDSESTVIVKLTGARTLPEVLEEAEKAYRTPERPNPLGVPPSLIDPREDKTPVRAVIRRLHPDLLARAWRGVLIVAPMADISDDTTLRDLAGFEYIQAAYAALGGREPGREGLHLDVYASIFQRAPLTPEPGESDVKFALIKFDATVKHTEIESGEIVFQLDVEDLWGKKHSPREPLYVRGTLPREAEGGGPRSFEFAAWFEKPKEINVDVAFVKAFSLRSVRVGRSQGRTSLDIDGDVVFQDMDLPLGIGFASDLRLGLENFRILLPRLGDGQRFDLGLGRALSFDFPSASFRLPRPHGFNLAGIELIPRGIGYVRRTALSALERLKGAYTWLAELDLPDAGDFVLPYLELRIDFGKLPQFGAGGLSGLTFDGLLGVQWEGGSFRGVSFGISGISGKDIKLDLFRLLTLEIKELAVGPFRDRDNREVGAFLAEDIRLKILDWSPLPEDAILSLLFLHQAAEPPRRGLLAWYANPDSQADRFFRLYWLLLAHNLELRREVHDALLSGDPLEMQERVDLVAEIVDEDAKRIDARLLDRESWLFGVSFGLGEILTSCNLILHDQHYYGIRLSAPWVEAAFGQKNVELAYIPGPRRELDRFRTNLRIPGLDMIGNLRSGEMGLEWAVNWDFLIDVGFPWQRAGGYDWFRSFSLPVGVYEAKFGFYFEKRTQLAPRGEQQLVLSAGVGFYLGYFFGFSSSIVWLRAGIGVFAILQGTVWLQGGGSGLALRGSVERLEVKGVVGIFAYGEGGIEVWILSARFRVSVQAAIPLEILFVRNQPCIVTYGAVLSAGYSASVRVGSGWFSWEFRVSGSVKIGVSGRLLLG